MANRLSDKVAVITGGNSGIGRATAQRFVEEGAIVFITGRNPETIEQTVAELGSEHAAGMKADASKAEEMEHVFNFVQEKYGPMDILFLNAGVAPITPLGATTEAQFDALFDVNVKGVFFAVQSAIPYFGEEGGSIIINSSAVNSRGLPGLSAYSATKAAVRSFARSFSAELHVKKIRVNTVSPGPIETPIYERMQLPGEQLKATEDKIINMTPARRFGHASEIADCVVFLASEESSYVMGADFAIDGGFAQI